MNSKYKIRSTNADEFELVLGILKEGAATLQSKGVDQWRVWLNPTPERLQWVREGFDNGEFYVFENQQKMIAGIYRLSFEDLKYWGIQEKPAGYVHSLTVRDSFSGRQLGKLILKLVEQQLLDKGVYLFRLDCITSNQKLCQYYESLGFKKVGEKITIQSLNNLYEKEI